MLEGAWPGLLLGGSFELSPGIHHGQTSRRAKPFLELGARRGIATGLVLAEGHGSIAVAATGKGLGAVALWWFLLLLLEGMVAPLQGASFHTVRG